MMDAKEFLRQPCRLEVLIRNKIIEADRWRSLALSITSNAEGDRVQSSSSQQRMADRINAYIDYEKETDELIDRLIDKKREVIQVIEGIENPFYLDLIHRKYIQYQTLEQIAEETGRTYDAIKKAHGRALQEVREILRKREGSL